MKSLRKTETIYPQSYIIKSDRGFEKKFNWTFSNIKWFLEAEETTDFYEKSIKELEPYIKKSKTVIDIGCGIGSFSISLAKKGLDITAIDMSSKVIEVLRKRAQKNLIQNINTYNSKFESITNKESYDIVLMSYMMGLVNDSNMEKILNMSNKYVVLILPIDEIKNDFSITELYERIGMNIELLKQQTYKELLEPLDRFKIKYDLKLIQSDFGQPFDSKEEALSFIKYYFKIPMIKNMQLVNWIEEKLIIKNKKYYLPNKKRSAMILIKV
ncbi:methyltransferase domain-containing protein [Maledivibacter halophilus]|uniref:Methyltransferase domain-containing protein n=1 Tax=Maledivibacter halophilus TaxID=36842 RepID=A0A1T5J6D2_9FIRM|nr:methyltransferase domain-containing protein [Maledivibacter halophilus]SKC46783.1 Methyltransferase domain-containing protein [Maledivibacter halophilus]